MILLALLGCAPDPCDIPDGDPLGDLTGWEQALLDGDGLPDPPEPSFLGGEQGLRLAFRQWEPPSWDGTGAVVLLVPGSTAHSGVYSALGQGMADRGVLVHAVDVRGHGLSVCTPEGVCGASAPHEVADDSETWPGRAGDSADPDQIVRDLSAHLAFLAAEYPQATLHLAGHSSGGGAVSRLVERGGAAWVDSVALLAPYNHPDQPQVRDEVVLDCTDTAGTAYARVDLGALGDALRGDVHRFVVRFHKSEALTTPLDTLAWSFTTTTGMSTADPDAFWTAYTVPVLLVAAEHDALLDPDRSAVEVARAEQGAFWLAEDHSHVGLSWSDEVAGVLADWFTTGVAP